jgi:hypothetical protein
MQNFLQPLLDHPQRFVAAGGRRARSAQTTRTVDPVVLRAARSACAFAASLSA